jgi:hypothetical protein
MPHLDGFHPENLPTGTTPIVGARFGAVSFIPTVGDPALTTDLNTADGAGVWVGYIEVPPAFTKTVSSGLVTFPNGSDVGTMALLSDTIINHDLVINYKLTDIGSNFSTTNLPPGGTTLQVAIVNGADEIYQTPINDLPQFEIIGLRKFSNGIHDTIILKGRIQHSNTDTVRIKFWAVNGSAVNGVRINCFTVNWQMNAE